MKHKEVSQDVNELVQNKYQDFKPVFDAVLTECGVQFSFHSCFSYLARDFTKQTFLDNLDLIRHAEAVPAWQQVLCEHHQLCPNRQPLWRQLWFLGQSRPACESLRPACETNILPAITATISTLA